MDLFKKAQSKEISIGGYKCSCCSPVAAANGDNKHKKKAKQILHQAARSRIKRELFLAEMS